PAPEQPESSPAPAPSAPASVPEQPASSVSNSTGPSSVPTFEGAAAKQYITGSVAVIAAALLAL
ncbi:hypothetical protein MGS_04266, partial [Candida albicans P78042]